MSTVNTSLKSKDVFTADKIKQRSWCLIWKTPAWKLWKKRTMHDCESFKLTGHYACVFDSNQSFIHSFN